MIKDFFSTPNNVFIIFVQKTNMFSVIGELQLTGEQLAKHYWVAGEQVMMVMIVRTGDDGDKDDGNTGGQVMRMMMVMVVGIIMMM